MRLLIAILCATVGYGAGPAISGYSLTPATSSELLAAWTTDVTADSTVTCGTTTGVYTITSETVNPLARGYSVLSHSMTIAGLLPSTTYFCRVISTSVGGSTTGATELSAATAAPVAQKNIVLSSVTNRFRYNDQFPGNGRRSQGDSAFCGWSGDGNTYCAYQDGQLINTATTFDTSVFSFPTSSDITLTNGTVVSALTNAGTTIDQRNTNGYADNRAWGTFGIFAVWDRASSTSILYDSLFRRGDVSNADSSFLKSPDFGLHWIAPANNTGPGVTGTLQGDMPATSAAAMWPGTSAPLIHGFVSTCQDHRDCPNTVANERSYQYAYVVLTGSNQVGLSRFRLENLPLQTPTVDYYTGSSTGDDGNYAGAWSTVLANKTNFAWSLNRFYPELTYLPDFHRYLAVSWEIGTYPDVTPLSILISTMQYPWSAPVLLGKIPVDATPNYLPAFPQTLAATYRRTSTAPLQGTIKLLVSGYFTGMTSDPNTNQYSLWTYDLNLSEVPRTSISGAVRLTGGVTVQ